MCRVLLFLSVISFSFHAFSQDWQAFTDSIPTLSSPRACDLNGDNVMDVVIGGGTDGVFSNNGIMAFNGVDGSLLWKRPSRNEVFGSAVFEDITNDGTKDVFIAGRSAQLLAIDGVNGQLLWDYFPYPTDPADSGLYNFYNPQFIQDVDGDSYPDILVSNGGDHTAPAWETDRPPGRLMVVSALTGSLLAEALVPDSAETYCSPLVFDVQNNGTKWILFGTGGENLGGHFYMSPLEELINNNTLENSIILAEDNEKGFIAPASVYKAENGSYNIYIQSFGGTLYKINGADGSLIWSYTKSGTESSAAPVIGNFTGTPTPDVALSLFKGIAPSYSDFYQVILDGATGEQTYIDSMGAMQYASGNAVDMNNDGRDEVLFSVTYGEDNYFQTRINSYDPVSESLTILDEIRTGVNLGSTPFIGDLEQDGQLDLIYAVKKDSIDPVAWKGINVFRHELNSSMPNAGIAWGTYMGSAFNGEYELIPVDCGVGSVISNVTISNPSCNGFGDGMILPVTLEGSLPLTFIWSTGGTESFLQDLPAGNYWVQVTNSQGCYEYSEFTLNDPFEISFGGIAPPTCIGDTNGMATLNSSGCYCMFSTCTFLWENGITTKPNSQLHEGWNSVLITHSNGCVVEDSVFIPSPAPVIDSIQVNHVAFCFGDATGSAIIFPNPIAQSLAILWSTNDTNDTIVGLTAGDYYVSAQDNRPCYDTIAFTISQPVSLDFSVTSTDVTCNGAEDGSIAFEISGGTSPYVYHVSEEVGSQATFTNLIATTYDVFVEDQNGCVGTAQSVTIHEPSILLVNTLVVTEATALTSLDGVVDCTVSGGTPPYSIQWNDPNMQSDAMAVYLNPGWYSATVLDSNGCTMVDSVYLGVLGLEESLGQVEQLFYPNPSSGNLYISEQCDNLHIFDTYGALVWQQPISSGKVELPLSSGVYTVELTLGSQSKKSRLIVLR